MGIPFYIGYRQTSYSQCIRFDKLIFPPSFFYQKYIRERIKMYEIKIEKVKINAGY